SATPAPFRIGAAHQLRLGEGEWLAGVFLGLERDRLLFRTAWADRLALPRRSARSLSHLPGWRTIHHEDFQGKLSAGKVEGDPEINGGKLTLARPDQALAVQVREHPSSGRVGVNFQARGTPESERWMLEAVFRTKGGSRTVRVALFDAGPSLA